MSRDVPDTVFDFQAGAKAAYESFGNQMRIKFQPWEELTAYQMNVWVKLLKAGIHEALEAKKRKVTGRLLRLLPAQSVAPIGRLVSTIRRTRGNPETD